VTRRRVADGSQARGAVGVASRDAQAHVVGFANRARACVERTLGEDIGQWPALRAAAKDAGLDPDAMQEAVESGSFQPEVERDLEEAQELGIHAVPTFVVGETHAVEGAQDAEVFRRLLRQFGAVAKGG
jgi:predicted DsbA family dithiol-disulfide isomerase